MAEADMVGDLGVQGQARSVDEALVDLDALIENGEFSSHSAARRWPGRGRVPEDQGNAHDQAVKAIGPHWPCRGGARARPPAGIPPVDRMKRLRKTKPRSWRVLREAIGLPGPPAISPAVYGDAIQEGLDFLQPRLGGGIGGGRALAGLEDQPGEVRQLGG